jgi:hypothetical protein
MQGSMKRIGFLLLIALACAAGLHAQERIARDLPAAAFITGGAVRLLPGNLQRHARYFSVAPDGAASTLGCARSLSVTGFPVTPDRDGALDLKRVRSVIDESTEMWMGGSKGSIRMPVPAIIALRGSVRGEPGSSVFLSYAEGELFGSVRHADGSVYVIAPATGGASGEHTIVAESDIRSGTMLPELGCRAQEAPEYYALPGSARTEKRSLAASALLMTNIAVEADYPFFRASGGTFAKASAYAAALFGMASVIYEDEINVTFHLSWFKVWGDSISDPYKVNGDAYALWDTVPRYWRKNYADVPRDLAHVLTSIGYGGGGKAFRGEGGFNGPAAICSRDYGYGMSSPQCGHTYPTFTFTYDVYIVAHELGHNFGARHTHDCWWNPPLDTCLTKDDDRFWIDDACYGKPITPRPNPGTIMSYCANTNYGLSNDFDKYRLEMTFSPRVAEVMRREAEAVPCLAEPPEAILILKNPRGGTAIPTSSPLDLRWAFAHVTSVSLAYSLDGGSHWEEIASGLPAADGHYGWTTPAVASQSMLVRIFDPSNGDVADTSILDMQLVSGVDDGGATAPASLDLALDPASGVLRVRYVLSASRDGVSLALFDAAGREVRIVQWLDHASAGEHEVELSVGDLARGAYFLTLDAGAGKITRGVAVTR